jgi:hypothetical protein
MDASHALIAGAMILIAAAFAGVVFVVHLLGAWHGLTAAHGLRYASAPTPHVPGTIYPRDGNEPLAVEDKMRRYNLERLNAALARPLARARTLDGSRVATRARHAAVARGRA